MLNTPVEFYIFGLTLAGVALLHKRTLMVAVAGLLATIAYKLAYSGFAHGVGWAGFGLHLGHEWVILSNLLLLLLGFAVLANQFELSHIPDVMPRLLPDNWLGGAALLLIVFVMSTILDNIAAAVIGAVIARKVYGGRVSLGFLAAIVACSNAGGAGSVIGDTTTTMMWIAGVSPLVVLKAFIASGVAFVVVAGFASAAQHRHQPIIAHVPGDAPPVDGLRMLVVVLLLAALLGTNFVGNAYFPSQQGLAPWLGLGLWGAILVTQVIRSPDWSVLPEAGRGAAFLVCLVGLASLMPVESLPPASWPSALGLGFLSAVFDNIPLTALALKQGGYDWGVLAFAVGFGGSMMWFGSSAGVAVSNLFPEARSVGGWLKQGWFVPVGYVAGFLVLLLAQGWVPSATRAQAEGAAVEAAEHHVDPNAAARFWGDARGLVDRALAAAAPGER